MLKSEAGSGSERLCGRVGPTVSPINHMARPSLLIFLLALLVVPTTASSQCTLTGRITDQNGKTLPGVNALLSGTAFGASSDEPGSYTMGRQPTTMFPIIPCLGLTVQW